MTDNKTKQNFFDSFWSIYENTRIEKITVKAICLKAGYNRSTFYEYFKDVFDVLEQIEENLLPNTNDIPEVLIGNQLIGANEFEHLNYFKEKKKYLKILLSENGDPSFTHKLKTTLKPSIRILFENHSNIKNIDYVLEYILSGMIGVMTYHILNDEPVDDIEVIETMRKLAHTLDIFEK